MTMTAMVKRVIVDKVLLKNPSHICPLKWNNIQHWMNLTLGNLTMDKVMLDKVLRWIWMILDKIITLSNPWTQSLFQLHPHHNHSLPAFHYSPRIHHLSVEDLFQYKMRH
ncbi:MAG: hypothetical protein CMJ95_01670 [Planctomycetes bacterium]|nr:hypothetical protein [Planctomycetota bacterium]